MPHRLIGLHPGWQVDDIDNILCDGCGKRIDASGAYCLDPATNKTYAVGYDGSHNRGCEAKLERRLEEELGSSE